MKVAGIDYSMTCPAITVIDIDNVNDEVTYEKCNFYYYTDKKKFDLIIKPIHGKLQTFYSSQMERFNLISEWVMPIIRDCVYIGIEDYSMGSKGKVFHIAENTGIIKHKMWRAGLKVEAFPPSIIKKFATGKGNADKFKMEEKFIEETGVNFKKIIEQTEKQWSPSGDLIDSYYIAKIALEKYKELDNMDNV